MDSATSVGALRSGRVIPTHQLSPPAGPQQSPARIVQSYLSVTIRTHAGSAIEQGRSHTFTRGEQHQSEADRVGDSKDTGRCSLRRGVLLLVLDIYADPVPANFPSRYVAVITRSDPCKTAAHSPPDQPLPSTDTNGWSSAGTGRKEEGPVQSPSAESLFERREADVRQHHQRHVPHPDHHHAGVHNPGHLVDCRCAILHSAQRFRPRTIFGDVRNRSNASLAAPTQQCGPAPSLPAPTDPGLAGRSSGGAV